MVEVRTKLTAVATLLPLDADVLRVSHEIQQRLSMPALDAVVLGSVFETYVAGPLLRVHL